VGAVFRRLSCAETFAKWTTSLMVITFSVTRGGDPGHRESKTWFGILVNTLANELPKDILAKRS